MKTINICKIFCLSTLLSACLNDKTNNNYSLTKGKEMKIDSIISEKVYSCKSKIVNGCLTIEMVTPQYEFYNIQKLKLIRELSIVKIKDELGEISEIYFEQKDTSKFNSFKPQKTLYKSKDQYKDLISFHSDSTVYNSEYYILKNITGKQLYSYFGIIDAIYKIEKKTEAPLDFITLVQLMTEEYKNKNCLGEYRRLMESVREFSKGAYESKDINFEPTHPDYFLNSLKCN